MNAYNFKSSFILQIKQATAYMHSQKAMITNMQTYYHKKFIHTDLQIPKTHTPVSSKGLGIEAPPLTISRHAREVQ